MKRKESVEKGGGKKTTEENGFILLPKNKNLKN
jgi:hypothetical protein